MLVSKTMKLSTPLESIQKIYLRRLDFELQKLLAIKAMSGKITYQSIYDQQRLNAIALLTGYGIYQCIVQTKISIVACKYL